MIPASTAAGKWASWRHVVQHLGFSCPSKRDSMPKYRCSQVSTYRRHFDGPARIRHSQLDFHCSCPTISHCHSIMFTSRCISLRHKRIHHLDTVRSWVQCSTLNRGHGQYAHDEAAQPTNRVRGYEVTSREPASDAQMG